MTCLGNDLTTAATLAAIRNRAGGPPRSNDPVWPVLVVALVDILAAYDATWRDRHGLLPDHLQARIDDLTREWLPGDLCDESDCDCWNGGEVA